MRNFGLGPDNPAFEFRVALVHHDIFAHARAIDPFGAQSFTLIGRGATYT